METAAIILKAETDKELLEELETLRVVRLSLAEKLLQNIDQTSVELKNRGLILSNKHFSKDELKKELLIKIKMLRNRLTQKNVVFIDEMELYMSLLEDETAAVTQEK